MPAKIKSIHLSNALMKMTYMLALLSVVVTSAIACDVFSMGVASDRTLKLVPADVNKLAMWNAETITSETLPEKTQEDFENSWGYLDDEFGIHIDDVNKLIRTQSKDGILLIVSGNLAKRDIRDKLEDRNYSDETYREYELWNNGGSAVALLSATDEDSDYAVLGEIEPVKDVLKALSRDSGSLLDANDSLTKQVLSKVGLGWYVSTFDSCEEFRGCEAYAVAVSDSREEFLVDIRFAFLFRNERAADSAASDVEDEIYDRYEIVDLKLKVEGEFVIIEASVDEDDSPY